MRRALAAVCLVSCLSASTVAQELTESTDYPGNLPGPMAEQTRGGCFFLASGTVEPGDVDWVGVTVPFPSDQTVIDVDFADGAGRSFMLVVEQGGSTFFGMADGNNAADDLCGLGSGSDPLGDTFDSAVDVGPTAADAVIDIAVTGNGDFGFTGGHGESFAYEIWIYAGEPDAGCIDDFDCDDGVDCTLDTCDASSGECVNEMDHAWCDNGVFCDGAEVCDASEGCLAGDAPCDDDTECDEEAQNCFAASRSMDLEVAPGVCGGWVHARGRGMVHVALLGTDSFDVRHVDPTSLVLARSDGVGEAIEPVPNGRRHHRLRDVGQPEFVDPPCDCIGRESDGLMDLIMKFRRQELGRAFDVARIRSVTTVDVTLYGMTMDGTPFEVSDCMHVTPHKRARRRSN